MCDYIIIIIFIVIFYAQGIQDPSGTFIITIVTNKIDKTDFKQFRFHKRQHKGTLYFAK